MEENQEMVGEIPFSDAAALCRAWGRTPDEMIPIVGMNTAMGLVDCTYCRRVVPHQKHFGPCCSEDCFYRYRGAQRKAASYQRHKVRRKLAKRNL